MASSWDVRGAVSELFPYLFAVAKLSLFHFCARVRVVRRLHENTDMDGWAPVMSKIKDGRSGRLRTAAGQ
jgi:hypothetical protein